MSDILIKRVITGTAAWQDPDDSRIGGIEYAFDYWLFNTVTKQVTAGSSFTREYYDDPPLQDVDETGEVHGECVPGTTTRNMWVHVGGVVHYEQDEFSVACGWQAPVCDLELTGTVTGYTATGVATGAHGTVRYSLDDGVTSQTSPVFALLRPDHDYEMIALDAGGCRATWAFRISSNPEPPFVPPVAEPVGVDFSLHPLWHVVAAAPAQDVVLDLYVELQHYGTFRRVVRLRARADAAGRAAFRLDGILHRQLTAFEPPAVATGVLLSRGNVRNYLVRTATVAAETGLPGAFTDSPVRAVLRGGLPVELRDVAYLAQRAAQALPPFLSWQPRPKRITPQQPEWWLWLCPPGTPRRLQVCRRYHTAALASSAYELVRVAPLNQSTAQRVLAVPVLPGAAPDVVRVDVWLEDEEGRVLSETLRFDVDEAHPRSRYFLFSNSLGGVDTLHTTGRGEATLDTKQDVATRPRLPDTPATAALAFVAAADPSRRLKGNTGPLTAAQWAWLQEFVLARERWEQRGARLLPLLLSKGSLVYARDERPLSGFPFEYTYAADPVAYANLP